MTIIIKFIVIIIISIVNHPQGGQAQACGGSPHSPVGMRAWFVRCSTGRNLIDSNCLHVRILYCHN